MCDLIYGTDKAIADYLRPVLIAELGEVFLRWEKEFDEVSKEAAALTRRIGLEVIAASREEDVRLQEDLLPGSMVRPPLNEACMELLSVVRPDQETLFDLYRFVLSEKCDLERMELAIHVAEENGDALYADKVREIMGLDEISYFAWWGD